MKIFITGIAGFVGSNLAKNLVKNGANVIGLTQSQKIDSLFFYEKMCIYYAAIIPPIFYL